MVDKPETTPNATLARESYDEKFDRMKLRKRRDEIQGKKHLSDLDLSELSQINRKLGVAP